VGRNLRPHAGGTGSSDQAEDAGGDVARAAEAGTGRVDRVLVNEGECLMAYQPTLRTPTEGRTIAVVGDVYRFLATGEDTGGKYAVWEATVLPGGGPPPHVHSREEEGFSILEGEITFRVGEERVVASAGTFANMPVGTPHSFKNESDKPSRMLISVAPAGLERMFFEIGVPIAQGATTAPPTSEEEIDKLLAVAPRYGIEIRLPRH
jgi:quercetin dioxygenase-like cupin family protein